MLTFVGLPITTQGLTIAANSSKAAISTEVPKTKDPTDSPYISRFFDPSRMVEREFLSGYPEKNCLLITKNVINRLE